MVFPRGAISGSAANQRMKRCLYFDRDGNLRGGGRRRTRRPRRGDLAAEAALGVVASSFDSCHPWNRKKSESCLPI
jgi:hypothetical protein